MGRPSTGISQTDADEIRAVTRPYWERLKASGHATPERMEICLWDLRDQGYTFDDIGLMFGVSRERVHQWCGRYNVSGLTPAGRPRQWNDDTHRFEASPTFAEKRVAESAARWRARRRVQSACRVKRWIEVRELIQASDCVPARMVDIALQVRPGTDSCSTAHLVAYLRWDSVRLKKYQVSAGDVVTAIWADAGHPPPPRGFASHARGGSRQIK